MLLEYLSKIKYNCIGLEGAEKYCKIGGIALNPYINATIVLSVGNEIPNKEIRTPFGVFPKNKKRKL